MRKEYNIIYLTNTPSFYKVNLFNEIAKSKKVLLVMYGYGSEAVNSVITSKNCKFDYHFLWDGDSAKRNKFKVFIKLLHLMNSIKADKILHGGWYVPEYCIYAFLSPKRKNVMLSESSIFESSITGAKGLIKRLIINRSSSALPSGKAHKEIFTQIGFKGNITITGGVGLINIPEGGRVKKETINSPLKYIYVGRLIECKNLQFLIERFNENGKPLTIVGKGELEEKLKSSANNNITFTGFIDNKELSNIYQQHDIFILPSRSEPWGLVVEESIYCGLPVVVSNKIGCYPEMVEDNKTGVIFELDNIDSFNNAITEIENNYTKYSENVYKYNPIAKDNKQVEAYLSL